MSNLNFGIAKRKTFTIDGDENRIISLDTSDTGIMGRLSAMQEFLNDSDRFVEEFEKANESATDDWNRSLILSKMFAERDAEMRKQLNNLFDSDVCTPIVGNGSVMRIVDGVPLYNTILERLLPLYEAEIAKQLTAQQKRISKHTAKYVKPTENKAE